MQRADLVAAGEGGVGFVGGEAGVLSQHDRDGIKLGVDVGDPGQVSVDHLTAADLSGSDSLRQLCC